MIIKDTQALCALIMVFVGLKIKDVKYKIWNRSVMDYLNWFAGVLGCLTTLSSIKHFIPPFVDLTIQFLFCIVCLLFYFLVTRGTVIITRKMNKQYF
ncbi:hypothetical protein I4U23_017423 [Adineta vaga]|nr:hypothetical protein I4U23_017423 [Adineta vaga]